MKKFKIIGFYECVAHSSRGQKVSVGTELSVASEFLFVYIHFNQGCHILVVQYT
jgi:hypothetical protein